MITFEVTDYVTSEMDGSVDVCVTVLNGVLVSSLTVNIDLLPSTAIGKTNPYTIGEYDRFLLYKTNRNKLHIAPSPSMVVLDRDGGGGLGLSVYIRKLSFHLLLVEFANPH